MLLIDLIIALLVTIFLTPLVLYGLRRRKQRPGSAMVSLVIFLSSWAGGIWMTPVGPSLMGVYWLSFLITGLIFALLFAALTSPAEKTTVVLKTQEEARKDRQVRFALSGFFWALIVALTFVIISGYLNPVGLDVIGSIPNLK